MAVNYKNGLYNVGSYQVSGYPFITGSEVLSGGPDTGEVKVEFPTVTKNVTVINTGSQALRVYFCAQQAANSYRTPGNTGSYPTGAPITGFHFVTLPNLQDSVSFDVKCREIFVASADAGGTNGGFECFAVLTGIDKEQMFMFTGSGFTD